MTPADHAAAYALQGWQILAIRPNDKRPQLSGWQSADFSATLDAISANSGTNLGIAVPQGIMVLDVDTKNDGPQTLAKLVAENGKLPNSLVATTPTSGKHIWMSLPSGVSVGNRVAIAPGLDVRTLGGYVVAPPSVINGAAYRWDNWDTFSSPVIAEAPGWLLALVNRPKENTKVTAGENFTIPEGQRNRTLFEGGAAMRTKGFSSDAIFDALAIMNAQSCNPPLSDEEVATIAASVSRYAPDAPVWEIFATPGELPKGALPVGTAHGATMRYRLLSGAEVCNAPPMRWMVRGVLPAEGLAALYGPSGSGKSFLILDIGCAVAGGNTEWFGRRVTQCPVAYVCLEGEAGMGKRVKAWSLHHGKPVPDALRFVTQPFNLRSADVPELAGAVIAGGGVGGLVIVDTLNRGAPGADENSSKDMGEIITAAKRLQTLVGGLVLLVHHTGKDESRGLRGHSSLYAALDGAIEVTKSDTRRAWNVAKSKDGEDGNAYLFRLAIVPVGKNEEGDLITSCVAVPDTSIEAILAKKITLGKNQEIAKREIDTLLRNSPHAGKDGAPLGKPCLEYDETVALVAERMPTERKHRKSRAQEAISGLVSKGILGMKEDWLWATC
jgi:AAA domain/Bifunctional DNA primase/polymerase, N-terminal/Primase C terminal 1 (PriCT-1)